MNNKLLTDEKEQKTFNNKLLKKISSKCGVPENEILVTYPQKGSYIVHVIFLFVASSGKTVAVSCFFSPHSNVRLDVFKIILLT